MTKQKVGLVMFWIGLIWMIAGVTLGGSIIMPLMRSLTTEEMNQTIWAFTGPLNRLYGVSMPLISVICVEIKRYTPNCLRY